MELRVGRPQKPFTVEVKRGRRGASSARLATAPKPLKSLDAKPAALPERKPAPPPPPVSTPPRRILDAIEPVIQQVPVEAVETLEAVEVLETAAPKRRRGRPPKAGRVPQDEAPASARASRKTTRRPEAAAVPVRAMPAPVLEPPPAREANQAAVHANGRIILANVAPGQTTHGRVTHGDRVEAATSLPRGERWKRRVPKVLW